jgi:opacity protein-like surface antigen
MAGSVQGADLQGPYVRLDAGYSIAGNPRLDYQGEVLPGSQLGNAALLGGGFGYRLSPNFRLDVTLSYRFDHALTSQGTDGFTGAADVASLVGMANGYYDITTYDRFTPYVTGGLGVARNHTGTNTLRDGTGALYSTSAANSVTRFAWQLGAGTAVALSGGLSLDLGYHYLDMGRFSTPDTAVQPNGTIRTQAANTGALTAHEVSAGLRYAF